MTRPTYVTQPLMPPLAEFLPYLERIWENKWLTNAGPFHQELESSLARYLSVEHLALFNNGTIALVTALQCLGITGEVITTPYSFVATSHSLLWNNLTPVFVDIDPRTLNLDPQRIADAITPRTTAILPVHCYGNPCAVDDIRRIADAHGLRVIYDAAHAFGVSRSDGSILRHGDLSVLSFHATKVFNTCEGGAIVCPDAATKQRIDHLKNFGFTDEVTVVAAGVNGKMNELQAAFGLLQLKHIDQALARRREIDALYRTRLADVRGLRCHPVPDGTQTNSGYFPIFIQPDHQRSRDDLYHNLRAHGINARRYFYPLISDFPMYRQLPSAAPERLPVARRAAEQVLCLPIHPALATPEVERICRLIVEGTGT